MVYIFVATSRELRRTLMSTSMRSATLTFLLLLMNASLWGQPSPKAAITPSRPIRDIVSDLRRFHGDPDKDWEVPPAVARNLKALKHGLRDMIVQTVAVPAAASQKPDAFAAELVERLRREDVPVGDSGGYGVISGIEFRRPPEYPSWLIATTTVAISYGEDTSLYLFELKDGAWKLALTQESNGYTEIGRAQGWLTYEVSPAPPGETPYLITAEVSPAMASVWQALRLRILRVGPDAEHPALLAKRTLSYCLDDTYYFSVHAGGFGLIFLGDVVDQELAGYRGSHYLEYRVSGSHAWVARDIAIDPYNVMRKWIAQNWTVARQTIDPHAADDLHGWHQRMQTGRWVCGLGEASLSHRAVNGNEELLSVADCTEGQKKKPSAYAVFKATHNGFRIVKISTEKPDTEEIVSVAFAGIEGLTNPVPVHVPQPEWPSGVPPAAKELKLRISAVVDEHGNVTSVNLLDWPDDRYRIVVPVIEAVKKWKYKPGQMNGKAVNVEIPVEVVFKPGSE
jgi:hypothetical protein